MQCLYRLIVMNDLFVMFIFWITCIFFLLREHWQFHSAFLEHHSFLLTPTLPVSFTYCIRFASYCCLEKSSFLFYSVFMVNVIFHNNVVSVVTEHEKNQLDGFGFSSTMCLTLKFSLPNVVFFHGEGERGL